MAIFLSKSRVVKPGSRGGKWWVDKKGEIQYGEKPTNKQLTKKTGDSGKTYRIAIDPSEYKKYGIPGDAKHAYKYSGHDKYNYEWRDSKGRLQRRYSESFVAQKQAEKYRRINNAINRIPELRESVNNDINGKDPIKKYTALAIKIIDLTGARVGNEKYTKRNSTHGITTLKKSQLTFKDNIAVLNYIGKKNIHQTHEIDQPEIVEALRELKQMPGERLFQIDARGNISADGVNNYLKKYGITAKDLRTFRANVEFTRALKNSGDIKDEDERKKVVARALKSVSDKLGNTPNVCRTNYISPEIVDSYLSGEISLKFNISKSYDVDDFDELINDDEMEFIEIWSQATAGKDSKYRDMKKSHVKAHIRTTKTGKIASVREYENRKIKKPDRSIKDRRKLVDYFVKDYMKYINDSGLGELHGLKPNQRKERYSELANKIIDIVDNKDCNEIFEGWFDTRNVKFREWFNKITGIKLPETQGETVNALIKYVGTEKYNEYKRAKEIEKRKREYEYEIQEAIDYLRGTKRVRCGGKIYNNSKELIDALLKDSRYKVEKTRVGIKPIYNINLNDEFGSFIPFSRKYERIYIDYVIENHKKSKVNKSIYKSHVAGHLRATKTGKIVNVRDYENRKQKANVFTSKEEIKKKINWDNIDNKCEYVSNYKGIGRSIYKKGRCTAKDENGYDSIYEIKISRPNGNHVNEKKEIWFIAHTDKANQEYLKDQYHTKVPTQIVTLLDTELPNTGNYAKLKLYQKIVSGSKNPVLISRSDWSNLEKNNINNISELVIYLKDKINQHIIQKKEGVINTEDKLYNEAKKHNNSKDFIDQIVRKGTILYRGGKEYSKYFSVNKNIANDYSKNRGGDVKEYILLPYSKVISYSKTPNIKYKDINDYNIERYSSGKNILDFMNNELEKDYIKAEKWAKDHGYDAIKYPTEGEIRIINDNSLTTKSQLIQVWNKAKGRKSVLTKPEDISKLFLDSIVNKIEGLTKNPDELSGAFLLKTKLKNKIDNEIGSFYGKVRFRGRNSLDSIKKIVSRPLGIYVKKWESNAEKKGAEKYLEYVRKQLGIESKLNKSIRYFIKSHVAGHFRKTETGKTVYVHPYDNSVIKEPEAGLFPGLMKQSPRIGDVTRISLDLIERDESQPREDFKQDELQKLGDSIKKIGLMQPIGVRPAVGGKHKIIFGERRWRASKLVGLKDIPARIFDINDKKELYAIQVAENLARADMNPIETANAYKKLCDVGMGNEEIAERVGVSPLTVQRKMSLTTLIPEIQNLIKNGDLPETHGIIIGLAGLRPQFQFEVLKKITDAKKKLNKEELDGIVSRYQQAQNQTFLFGGGDSSVITGTGQINKNKVEAVKRQIANMLGKVVKAAEKIINDKNYKLAPAILKEEGKLARTKEELKLLQSYLSTIVKEMESAEAFFKTGGTIEQYLSKQNIKKETRKRRRIRKAVYLIKSTVRAHTRKSGGKLINVRQYTNAKQKHDISDKNQSNLLRYVRNKIASASKKHLNTSKLLTLNRAISGKPLAYAIKGNSVLLFTESKESRGYQSNFKQKPYLYTICASDKVDVTGSTNDSRIKNVINYWQSNNIDYKILDSDFYKYADKPIIKKSVNYLIKGTAFPVGHISIYKDGTVWKKVSNRGKPGDWKEIKGALKKQLINNKEHRKLSDFGEKIGGARKDLYSKLKSEYAQARKHDIRNSPLSKTFPEPDYQKLIESGHNPLVVGIIRSIRDEIPNKPSNSRHSYKIDRWVSQVETLRNFAESIINNEIPLKVLIEKIKNNPALKNVLDRAELYQLVGHDKSLKGITIGHHYWSLYRGKKNVWKWTIEKKPLKSSYGRIPKIYAEGNTREEALKKFKIAFALESGKSITADEKFIIYRYKDRNKQGYYIGKKLGRNYIDIKQFDSLKEAQTYLKEHPDIIKKLYQKKIDIPSERRDINRERKGKNYRKGKDINPQLFQNTFGFRGVEFGNWVNNKERQTNINRTYDALYDLSMILNIPTQALSLNGELGLAFGSRGKGGKNAPAAHYESDKVVINLIRKEGAGSLAHEWFHALDNYLSRQRGLQDGYITDKPYKIHEEKLDDDLIEAFSKLDESIRKTGLPKRSKNLDKLRSKQYWTLQHEMIARSFENYVVNKLSDNNYRNDYLANFKSWKEWAADANKTILSDDSITGKDLYPYLNNDEEKPVIIAFDRLFKTIRKHKYLR